MPYIDPQTKFGVNLDRWLVLQSSQQPRQRAARCHGFEKELVECSHGIGRTRALKECRLEMEDFKECMSKHKMVCPPGSVYINAMCMNIIYWFIKWPLYEAKN